MHTFQQHYRKWITGSLLVLCTIAMGKLNMDAWSAMWPTSSTESMAMTASWEQPTLNDPSVTLAESVFSSVVNFAHSIGQWTLANAEAEQISDSPCLRQKPQIPPTPTIVPVIYLQQVETPKEVNL